MPLIEEELAVTKKKLAGYISDIDSWEMDAINRDVVSPKYKITNINARARRNRSYEMYRTPDEGKMVRAAFSNKPGVSLSVLFLIACCYLNCATSNEIKVNGPVKCTLLALKPQSTIRLKRTHYHIFVDMEYAKNQMLREPRQTVTESYTAITDLLDSLDNSNAKNHYMKGLTETYIFNNYMYHFFMSGNCHVVDTLTNKPLEFVVVEPMRFENRRVQSEGIQIVSPEDDVILKLIFNLTNKENAPEPEGTDRIPIYKDKIKGLRLPETDVINPDYFTGTWISVAQVTYTDGNSKQWDTNPYEELVVKQGSIERKAGDDFSTLYKSIKGDRYLSCDTTQFIQNGREPVETIKTQDVFYILELSDKKLVILFVDDNRWATITEYELVRR